LLSVAIGRPVEVRGVLAILADERTGKKREDGEETEPATWTTV